MIKDLINVHKILSIKEKTKLFLNVALKIILSLLEGITVLSFVPFLSLISNKDLFFEKSIFVSSLSFLNLSNQEIYIAIILLPLLSIVILNLYRPFMMWHSSRTAADIWRNKHYDLFNYYLNKNYLFHLNNSSNKLLERLLQRTNSAVAGVIFPAYEIIGALFSSAFLTIIPMLYNPYIGLICLGLIIIFYFIFYQYFKNKIRVFGEYQPIFAQETYKLVDESFKSIKDIKLRKNYNFFSEQFFGKIKKYSDNSVVFDFLSSVPRSITEIFGFSFILIASVVLLIMSNYKIEETIITLGVYLLALQRLIPTIQNLFQQVSQYKLYKKSFYTIYNDLLESNKFKINSSRNNKSKYIEDLKFKNEIKLVNISFSYPDNRNFELKIDNLLIKKGDILGISGKSGHGKSTFVNIITGLIKPDSGKLFLDEMEINFSNLEFFQKKITYVPQNIFVLDDTIEQNIAFGLNEKFINQEKLRKASEIAGISDFIENELKDKYKTIVGENAIKLSGGQRQRLGLARALYEDKEIIFLDEATGALDKLKESEILDKICSMKDKTIVIVTHNPLILQKLPRILYFDKGQLNLKKI